MNAVSTLPLTGDTAGAASSVRVYSRAAIPDDRVVEPYRLAGTRRTVFLAIYAAIVATALGGLAYAFVASPLFALTALVIGYCFDNLAFTCGHVGFHAEFVDNPEPKMKTLPHHAFIHHYRNIFVFHETWLETRLSYFVDPRMVLTPKSAVKFLAIATVIFPFVYLVHPLLGITVYAAQAVPLLIQSMVHEWYHNPARNRKAFYTPPVYWFFTALEKVGLASTKNHLIHHRHGLDDLDNVHKWLDLYLPFGEGLPTRLWTKALALYEPGKANMAAFARRGDPFKWFLAFRLAASTLITVAFFLLVR